MNVLASELEAPGDVLAVETIYFVGKSGGLPSIIAVPKPGGSPQRIIDEARNVLGMAVDAQGFYWLELPNTIHDAQIWTIARAGDQPRMILNAGTGIAVHGLALDASHVWWTAFNVANQDPLGTKQIAVQPGVDAGATPERVLRRAPRAGGPIEDIAYGDNLYSLLAVRGDVYVADPLMAYRNGGRKPALIRAYVGSGVAADDTYIYWQEEWLVRRVPLLGGRTTDLAALQFMDAGYGAAYKGSYFIANERELIRVDADGTTSLVAKGRASIAGLAADDSGVYWTTADGRLLRSTIR